MPHLPPDPHRPIVETLNADADGLRRLVELFAEVAGRAVRLTLAAAGESQVYEGRVPPRRQWRSPEEPYLLVRPGSTDGVHVLADMALHLRVREGQWFIARRRWYEHEDLDMRQLGVGPLHVTLVRLLG